MNRNTTGAFVQKIMLDYARPTGLDPLVPISSLTSFRLYPLHLARVQLAKVAVVCT